MFHEVQWTVQCYDLLIQLNTVIQFIQSSEQLDIGLKANLLLLLLLLLLLRIMIL